MNDKNFPKQTIADLALFGGMRLFPEPVVVGRPNIPDADAVAEDIRRIFSSGTLSNNGPFVHRFEEEVSRITGAEHCVATNNATSALELVCRALVQSGEVIVPSFTFIATAHALAWQGLKPVFVDVDPISHTIDPASVEAAITPATVAICGVHLWGNVCDVEALQAIAEKHGLALWFDAAHAFSVKQDGARVGNFGNAEVFSFHATKFINACEGGAIVTNDAALAKHIREMRNFGFDETRQVKHIGINAKMPETSAAVGLRSLDNLERISTKNRDNYYRYGEFLAGCPGVELCAPLDPSGSNCQYVAIELDGSHGGISRDQLMNLLKAEGVLTQRYWHPGCHKAAPYRDEHLKRRPALPVTERLSETVLALPTGTSVSTNDIEKISALIRFAMEAGESILKVSERKRVRI